MNLPNKLTIARVGLIPVFVLLYLSGVPHSYFWALVVFGAASFTDYLDGYLARKKGLVTDFGVLMDPLADKLLVMSAIILFLHSQLVHAIAVIILLGREFLVTSIRLVAAGKGRVIAADKWGKIKTAFQMTWICLGLFFYWLTDLLMREYGFSLLGSPEANTRLILTCWAGFHVLTWIVVALTALSGANYALKNRALFRDA
ncbi:MAG: CDP-diacylglycerol--glycerol-3-phosphate 3-phosphatidyltransferase [Oscillospiraceae bacterium]|nr:CDP-diacylglycerol--glycerol-3-phosphate 3-phosphatidyltransferase [Oscillospiraceae bacterium]